MYSIRLQSFVIICVIQIVQRINIIINGALLKSSYIYNQFLHTLLKRIIIVWIGSISC